MEVDKTTYMMELQCFPLYSMLLALGNPTVSFDEQNEFLNDIENYDLACHGLDLNQFIETIPDID